VTVHEKWDVNTAILSGDAMLILAYRFFENYKSSLFRELAKLFSKTALQVCEGQQYDVDFETRDDVSLPEYIKMIDYKTAVLVGASMKMGAIVAEASESCQENIYKFGRNLGIAFQLQDDYLDAFGNPKNFGKQLGGDIITNKKTILYLLAMEKGTATQINELSGLYSIQPEDPKDKIKNVMEIFETTGAAQLTRNEIERYTQKANEVLDQIAISPKDKQSLRDFGNQLMKRTI
jgi:geranylgeranyl diphosphate synthase type II